MNGDNEYGKSHIIGEWEVKSQRNYITITNGPKRCDFVFANRAEIDKMQLPGEIGQLLGKTGIEILIGLIKTQVSNRKRRPNTIHQC